MPRGRPPSHSVENAFRSLIRSEIAAQLQPLQTAVRDLQARAEDLGLLQELAEQLSPLASLLAPLTGQPPTRRTAVRPAGRRSVKPGRRGRPAGRSVAARACAIIGCKRPARSKGYCGAHYQKLRMLTRTHRKPSAWTDFPPPNSVPDLVLPRGRAAHKR